MWGTGKATHIRTPEPEATSSEETATAPENNFDSVLIFGRSDAYTESKKPPSQSEGEENGQAALLFVNSDPLASAEGERQPSSASQTAPAPLKLSGDTRSKTNTQDQNTKIDVVMSPSPPVVQKKRKDICTDFDLFRDHISNHEEGATSK